MARSRHGCSSRMAVGSSSPSRGLSSLMTFRRYLAQPPKAWVLPSSPNRCVPDRWRRERWCACSSDSHRQRRESSSITPTAGKFPRSFGHSSTMRSEASPPRAEGDADEEAATATTKSGDEEDGGPAGRVPASPGRVTGELPEICRSEDAGGAPDEGRQGARPHGPDEHHDGAVHT